MVSWLRGVKPMIKSDAFKQIAIFTIISWLTMFVFIPNLGVIAISFLERDESNFVKLAFTTGNYTKLFSPIYLGIFLKTFTSAAYVTLICLFFSYPFVYIVSQRVKSKKAKDILIILVVIPFWTSSLIRTYAMMIVLRTNGILNTALIKLGLIDSPIEFLYSSSAVRVGLVYSLLPFMILPLYTIFEKLDQNYIHAAEDLGANKFNIFWRIIIPLTKSGIIGGSIMVFLSSLGMFFVPELLGGNREFLAGNLIQNQFLIARDWPFGTAICSLLTFFVIILMVFYARTAKNNEQIVV